MVKALFRVEGMYCPNCAMRIEGLEDSLPGIQRLEVNYVKGRMQVIYNEATVTEAEILEAIEKMGYIAQLV